MNREVPAPFYEGLEVKFLWSTLLSPGFYLIILAYLFALFGHNFTHFSPNSAGFDRYQPVLAELAKSDRTYTTPFSKKSSNPVASENNEVCTSCLLLGFAGIVLVTLAASSLSPAIPWTPSCKPRSSFDQVPELIKIFSCRARAPPLTG